MSKLTRRSMLQRSLTGLAAAALAPRWLEAADTTTADVFPYPVIGQVRPVPSTEIEASPLSVGFETLDRKMFDPERTYEHLARLGVKWARVQTGWARTETTAGQYDFAWLDAIVDRLREMGVQPWFNLGYGNKLYTPDAPDTAAVGWIPIFTESAQKAWVRYTRAITEHFRDRVRHWEIWNEPNITNFWKPQKPSPKDYVRFVKLTASEIRQQLPEAVLIGGAFSGMPTEYLEDALAAGLAEHVDRISFHPYRATPEANYAPTVAQWKEMLAKHKPELRLWQGENGCPSETGGTGALRNFAWNETRQAKWVLRRILSDLKLDLELTSYFHLVDLVNYNWGSGPSGATNYKGLLHGTDYTPKPSYYAYQCLCALFDSRTRRAPELALEVTDPKEPPLETAAFVREQRALVAYWYPADLQTDWQPQKASLKLSPTAEATLSEPVLIDPFHNRIYQLDARPEADGSVRFQNLPLVDYPLLIADRSMLSGLLLPEGARS